MSASGEEIPAVIDMQAVQAQMADMLKGYKAEQQRQMDIYKSQMKAQKELNRSFIWYLDGTFIIFDF